MRYLFRVLGAEFRLREEFVLSQVLVAPSGQVFKFRGNTFDFLLCEWCQRVSPPFARLILGSCRAITMSPISSPRILTAE